MWQFNKNDVSDDNDYDNWSTNIECAVFFLAIATLVESCVDFPGLRQLSATGCETTTSW